mgnify:CR=1 FL=1
MAPQTSDNSSASKYGLFSMYRLTFDVICCCTILLMVQQQKYSGPLHPSGSWLLCEPLSFAITEKKKKQLNLPQPCRRRSSCAGRHQGFVCQFWVYIIKYSPCNMTAPWNAVTIKLDENCTVASSGSRLHSLASVTDPNSSTSLRCSLHPIRNSLLQVVAVCHAISGSGTLVLG